MNDDPEHTNDNNEEASACHERIHDDHQQEDCDDVGCDDEFEMAVDCEDEDLPDYCYKSLEASSRTSTSRDASPVPRLLPLRRPPSTAATAAYPTPLNDSAMPKTSSQPLTTGAAACDADEERSGTDGAPPVDKIGSYFGYNGTDGNVPKPAYDAMLQRVRTLEDALGNANRELRTQAKTIADQEGKLQSMRQQVEQSEALLQRMPALEAALAARQRDLDFREQALEHVARQQRRLQGKRRHQQQQQDEDVDNEYVALHDAHGLSASTGGVHGGPSLPSCYSDDAPLQHPLGAGSRRRTSVEASGGSRREEEAYMTWMNPNILSPTAQVAGARRISGSQAATSLASLLEAERNARRALLLPRIPMVVGTQRSQTSLGT